jgi:tripartite-type tricarboxylate transporter receptor subunit TctC
MAANTGRIRGLAVSSLNRSTAAPDIPTIHKSGVADYEEGGQHGIVAPAGLPKDVLVKLHGSIVSAMRTPEITKRLAEDGSSVAATTPDEFRTLIRRETVK